MRDKVYNFAGCVMDGAPYLTPLTPNPSAFGISTDGVLRLLHGRTIALEPNDLMRLRAANPLLPEHVGRYDPIAESSIHAIFWTPINDAIYLTPKARCDDKSAYPIYNGAIDQVLGTTSASLSLETIVALWHSLIEATSSIPHKFMVLYPTVHLDNSPWKKRIDEITALALAEFRDVGWLGASVEPELEPGQRYWAHFCGRAKVKLWDDIAKTMR